MTCKICKNCKYVSKTDAKNKRAEIWSFLKEVNINMKEKVYNENNKKYKGFTAKIVGSSKRNMITQTGNSVYDTDIQIEFTSKCAGEYPATMKHDFMNSCNDCIGDRNFTVDNSTSVIRINMLDDNGVLLHSCDLAIIRPNMQQIARGKNNDKSSNDYYNWNDLGDINQAYTDFKNMDNDEVDEVKEIYIDKKCNRPDNKDDENYKTSSSLFIESVNEVK